MKLLHLYILPRILTDSNKWQICISITFHRNVNVFMEPHDKGQVHCFVNLGLHVRVLGKCMPHVTQFYGMYFLILDLLKPCECVANLKPNYCYYFPNYNLFNQSHLHMLSLIKNWVANKLTFAAIFLFRLKYNSCR